MLFYTLFIIYKKNTDFEIGEKLFCKEDRELDKGEFFGINKSKLEKFNCDLRTAELPNGDNRRA